MFLSPSNPWSTRGDRFAEPNRQNLRRYSGVILPKTAGTITNRRSADSLSRLIEVESITGG